MIVDRIPNIVTSFKIEFAYSSEKTRDGAPTLIPVEKGGAKNNAQILLLKEGITVRKAKNMLWRRETRKTGWYKKPVKPGKNSVYVKSKTKFHDIDVVLYTKIEPNITPLTPHKLAQLAIDSARSKSGGQELDGISYLIQMKKNGIHTPLMERYEKEILRETGTETLEDALRVIRNQLKNTP